MFFTIYKSKQLLNSAFRILKRSKKHISEKEYLSAQSTLKAFQNAILNKDLSLILNLTPKIKELMKNQLTIPFYKKFLKHTFELVLAIIAAFVLIRPMWFELYQIPSGSMRPTFKEDDRLTVSKTQFGINIPLTPKHFLFSPSQVKRNGTITFTGEGMDIQEGMTNYFYLFKGYKQYVKRLIGKPLDTLYFYGGKIYGLDRNGESIDQELNIEILSKIDHVPFLNFEGVIKPRGRTAQNLYSPVYFYQNGLPVLKMQALGPQVKSEILYSNGQPIEDYYELFGMGHYGMCRIVKKDQYYLEIVHHPSIKGAKIQQDIFGRYLPTLSTSKSYLPLNESALKTIFQNLYTARFTVKNGLVKRSSQNSPPLDETSSHVYPKIEGIPDGTYEYYYGTPYEVLFQGHVRKLGSDHPLSQFSIEKTIALFNFGIEFDLAYAPDSIYKIFPSRFTYYRFGDLFVMGAKILDKSDPALMEFIATEKSRTLSSKDFVPFIDFVPPMIHDKIDPDFIKRYGLKIPEKSYYALGDNYAMSADSRRFGFVPEGNLRGVPDLIFWPFGERLGHPLQPAYPLIVPSRIIIWVLALLSYILYKVYQKKKGTFPYRFED